VALYNNTNTHDDIYGAIIYGASYMREFTFGHLGENRSAPVGCQLVNMAANLTFEWKWKCVQPVTAVR